MELLGQRRVRSDIREKKKAITISDMVWGDDGFSSAFHLGFCCSARVIWSDA